MSVLDTAWNLRKDIWTMGASGAQASQNKSLAQQQADLDQMQKDLALQKQIQSGQIKNTFDPFSKTSSTDMDAWRTSAGQDLSKFNFDPFQKFDPNSVNEYMNPYLQDQINAGTQAVEESSANRGQLFSGANAKAVSDYAQKARGEAFDKASGLARDDWKTQMEADRLNKTQGLNIAGTQTSNLKGIADTSYDALMKQFGLGQNLESTYNANVMDLNKAKSILSGQQAGQTGLSTQIMQAVPSWIDVFSGLSGGGK